MIACKVMDFFFFGTVGFGLQFRALASFFSFGPFCVSLFVCFFIDLCARILVLFTLSLKFYPMSS